ncbi:hypothetical protein [Galbitalea soli]|uniref:TadE family protein n=1 Tax=Galbitalea soli TaxID=1268042 RepID=A0A7C9TPV9_9MICO|nr:hypothetical protein [Galbitalea soli]NEM90539.1 hypothetical protein [Galbitalea soli]NYJ31252.1 hypothetical protein [Galbitalea soli]
MTDRGSAPLEFVTTGLILLVPIVYLLLAIGSIQGAAMAVEGAARGAARVVAEGSDDADARAQAVLVARTALHDFGVSDRDTEIRIDCRPRPARCLSRGGTVRVTVIARAALPLVPDALNLREPMSIPVEASAVQRVSEFAGVR